MGLRVKEQQPKLCWEHSVACEDKVNEIDNHSLLGEMVSCIYPLLGGAIMETRINVINVYMMHPYKSKAFEMYAPVVARVIFGLQFLMGATFKIPGTEGFVREAAMTAAAGWPLASVSVFLAFVLEVGAGLMLVLGWHTRAAAFMLAAFTLILAFLFYRNFSDQMVMGAFISHIAFVAGLLYVSVYGAKTFALRKD